MSLADRLGTEQAERLSEILGGTHVSIPDNLTASVHNAGRLRAKVGDSLFALLVFHFGGTRVYVPQAGTDGRSANKAVSERTVARLTRRGWSAARIARFIGCSERTIFTLRASLRSRARSIKQPKNGGNEGVTKP